jgi:hypothetical protein
MTEGHVVYLFESSVQQGKCSAFGMNDFARTQLIIEQRVSDAVHRTDSYYRPAPLSFGNTSEGIEDLLQHTRESSQPLWQRRKSSRSTEAAVGDVLGAFNLDLLSSYEEEQDEITQLPSPSPSTLPPRISSLSNPSPPQRSLSLEQGLTGQRLAGRRTNPRSARPEPIRIPNADSVEEHAPHIQSARLAPTPPLAEHDAASAPFKKSHRRHMTISESKKAARSTVFISDLSGKFREHDLPPMPGLSPSLSMTTSSLSPIPGTPASATAPRSEDQIRRELESLTLQDGADSLLTHRYGGRVDADLVMKLEKQADGDHDPTSPVYRSARSRSERDPSDAGAQSHARRRKSIVEYFGRRSPVDKLLDYYLDDHKETDDPRKAEETTVSHPETPPVKRKQSLSRRMTLTFRGSPKDKSEAPPPLPPPPPIPAGMI